MNLIVRGIMTAAAALSASALIVACGAHSTNPPNESFTVYEDAPKMSLLDVGQPGNSPGDVYYFSAPLRSSAGGQITGEVFGSKTLIKLASEANPNVEKRGTLLFFTFGAGQDQIVVFGITDYSPTAGEFAAGKPVVRPVLGGTGKYMGARGQVTSTRNADGWYTQVFTLIK
jgi:hypothetical protein